jgi:hypothetical protein
MAASRRNQGPVVISDAAQPSSRRPAAATRLHDGSWRTDDHFVGHGLRITLRRAHGVTSPDVLRVPLRMQAPVVGDLVIDDSFNWTTYDTLRLGQRLRRMGQQLRELPVSTMLLDGPAQDSSSGLVVWPFAPEPLKIIDELRYIAGMAPGGKATPFRLVIDQPLVWGDDTVVSHLAVLTRVSATQKPDEVGTWYLDLTFLRFHDDEIARHRQPRDDEKTRHHDLKHGDSLYDLAKRYYHQPSAWHRIADANGIKGVRPGSDDDLAAWAKRHHKQQLKIPPSPKAHI